MNSIDHWLKEQVIRLIKDKLCPKIMIKFLGLRARAFRYWTYEGSEDKKATQKKCVIKRRHKFENYKNCLEATKKKKKISRK